MQTCISTEASVPLVMVGTLTIHKNKDFRFVGHTTIALCLLRDVCCTNGEKQSVKVIAGSRS